MSNKALSEHKQVTNAPEVSSELIQELARMCGLVPSHTTAEWVSTLVRFVRVVLDNNSVQEAFVRANAGLLSVSSAVMTDEQIDVIWSDTRETLPQPVSETFTMRAFARAILAAQPPAASRAAITREQIRAVFLANGFTVKPGHDDLKEYVYEAASALIGLAWGCTDEVTVVYEDEQTAAQPPAAAEAETEQSIAADCYHWIADRIGTRDGYSVQEHIDLMCNVLDECSDYFHDFPESAVGGDDEGVRIAANLRALKAGKLEDVDDAAMSAGTAPKESE